MEPVFFRQEVLVKYQGDSGFDVRDDGSVSCHGERGLTRSTWRLGNGLLATAIGDFAQGVPFHEWPHWQQHAVEPASSETVAVLKQEQTVAGAVNSLVQALAESVPASRRELWRSSTTVCRRLGARRVHSLICPKKGLGAGV
jgi:hypothetical protein